MRDDLTAAGDLMQSAGSRVLAWLDEQTVPPGGTPYEVSMAMLELRDAVTDWTNARSLTDICECGHVHNEEGRCDECRCRGFQSQCRLLTNRRSFTWRLTS
jgi:hypothetical protein